MKYDELVKSLRHCSANPKQLCINCPSYDRVKAATCSCAIENMAKAADAIEELTAALTASNEVIATQRKQLAEYHKYDTFLAAHGCFDSVEPPKEDVKDKCVNVNM